MLQKITIVACLLLPAGAFAQDAAAPTTEKRNEIGLNVSPLLAGLAGGFQDEPTLNLRYKTGDQLKFRVIAQSKFITQETWPSSSTIEKLTDTSMFVMNNNYNNGGDYDLRLGIERQYQKGQWGWYWGADLLMGYQEDHTSYYYSERYYTLDDEGNIEFQSPYSDPNYTIPDEDYGQNVDQYNWYAGLAGSLGLYYDIGSSWRLTAELPLRYYVAFGGETKTTTIQSNNFDITEDIQKNNETTQNFNVEFINFLVSYKF